MGVCVCTTVTAVVAGNFSGFIYSPRSSSTQCTHIIHFCFVCAGVLFSIPRAIKLSYEEKYLISQQLFMLKTFVYIDIGFNLQLKAISMAALRLELLANVQLYWVI